MPDDAGARRPAAADAIVAAMPVDPWEPIEGRCNSRKTRGVGLCRNTAGFRTDHLGDGLCWLHGGRSPNGKAHAAKARVAREIGELMQVHLAGVDVVDPLAAVMDVVRSTWARRRVLELRVAELLDRPATADDAEPGEVVYGPNHNADLVPHVLVTMLERAEGQHLTACKVAIDAGIAERVLRIEEDKWEVLAQAVKAIVTGLGHSMEDPEVIGVIDRSLRALPGGAA